MLEIVIRTSLIDLQPLLSIVPMIAVAMRLRTLQVLVASQGPRLAHRRAKRRN